MCGGLGVNSSRCLSFIFSMQALKEKRAAVSWVCASPRAAGLLTVSWLLASAARRLPGPGSAAPAAPPSSGSTSLWPLSLPGNRLCRSQPEKTKQVELDFDLLTYSETHRPTAPPPPPPHTTVVLS